MSSYIPLLSSMSYFMRTIRTKGTYHDRNGQTGRIRRFSGRSLQSLRKRTYRLIIREIGPMGQMHRYCRRMGQVGLTRQKGRKPHGLDNRVQNLPKLGIWGNHHQLGQGGTYSTKAVYPICVICQDLSRFVTIYGDRS